MPQLIKGSRAVSKDVKAMRQSIKKQEMLQTKEGKNIPLGPSVEIGGEEPPMGHLLKKRTMEHRTDKQGRSLGPPVEIDEEEY